MISVYKYGSSVSIASQKIIVYENRIALLF